MLWVPLVWPFNFYLNLAHHTVTAMFFSKSPNVQVLINVQQGKIYADTSKRNLDGHRFKDQIIVYNALVSFFKIFVDNHVQYVPLLKRIPIWSIKSSSSYVIVLQEFSTFFESFGHSLRGSGAIKR